MKFEAMMNRFRRWSDKVIEILKRDSPKTKVSMKEMMRLYGEDKTPRVAANWFIKYGDK